MEDSRNHTCVLDLGIWGKPTYQDAVLSMVGGCWWMIFPFFYGRMFRSWFQQMQFWIGIDWLRFHFLKLKGNAPENRPIPKGKCHFPNIDVWGFCC